MQQICCPNSCKNQTKIHGYLKGTRLWNIYLSVDDVNLIVYADKDWAGSQKNMKRTFKFLLHLDEEYFFGYPKKSKGCCSIILWSRIYCCIKNSMSYLVQGLRKDTGYKMDEGSVIHGENKSAIVMSENQVTVTEVST